MGSGISYRCRWPGRSFAKPLFWFQSHWFAHSLTVQEEMALWRPWPPCQVSNHQGLESVHSLHLTLRLLESASQLRENSIFLTTAIEMGGEAHGQAAKRGGINTLFGAQRPGFKPQPFCVLARWLRASYQTFWTSCLFSWHRGYGDSQMS